MDMAELFGTGAAAGAEAGGGSSAKADGEDRRRLPAFFTSVTPGVTEFCRARLLIRSIVIGNEAMKAP